MNERITSKKQLIQANREASKALKKLITDITDELNLDEERMAKRIDSASRSEYGSINGLINLLASIANWPAESGDGSMVSTNRMILESKFNLDLMMLDDIRTYRGYHSFVTDELEIIDGVEPQYEDYTDYCQIFLEELSVTTNRPTIDREKWSLREEIAREKAKLELTEMKAEVAKHKEFVAANS